MATGATPSQLEHWSRTGLIQPQVPSGGTGRHRAFSLVNLIEIAIAVRLNRFRLPIAVIRVAVAYLAHDKFLTNSKLLSISVDDRAGRFEVTSQDEGSATGRDASIVVNIATIVTKLLGALKPLETPETHSAH